MFCSVTVLHFVFYSFIFCFIFSSTTLYSTPFNSIQAFRSILFISFLLYSARAFSVLFSADSNLFDFIACETYHSHFLSAYLQRSSLMDLSLSITLAFSSLGCFAASGSGHALIGFIGSASRRGCRLPGGFHNEDGSAHK